MQGCRYYYYQKVLDPLFLPARDDVVILNINVPFVLMFDFFFLLGSGQQILGPPRKKQTSDDFTQSMFDEAKRYLSRTT